MSFSTLLYEIDSDGLAVVTINRPDSLNALNADVINDLDECFRQAKIDESVRGIVLTGEGPKSFVAGADIKQFSELDPVAAQRFAVRGQSVFNRIEEMTKPVVAAVNGFALGGGCELAISCHMRIASENARFGQPEVSLGLIPGYGGTQRLPRLIGRGIATELVLTGELISAKRAYEIGLVNKVVPLEDLLDTAKSMLKTIASKAPIAVAFALEAMRASELPLRQGLRHEAALFGQTFATEDFKEGISAFLEKRKAMFKGR